MMRPQKGATKSGLSDLLQRLSPEEAAAVLRHLLAKHSELRSEAEQFATDYVSSGSIEEVAQEVYDRIIGIDMDALNGRTGKHSWGYVEPSEAAVELMGESLEDLVDDMKRKAELGLLPAAQVACAGIVQGLYQARDTKSDGALGWAPDFPAEHADYVVGDFLRACPVKDRKEARNNLTETLAMCAPEWAERLLRAANEAAKS
ncbi:MAG: hypothetical protein ABSH48_20875 [Verrucomicrobiota bacterium]